MHAGSLSLTAKRSCLTDSTISGCCSRTPLKRSKSVLLGRFRLLSLTESVLAKAASRDRCETIEAW